MNELNIYHKLNDARVQFHRLQLKKTGLNKFAGYQYFELADFLIPALTVFHDNGLCAFISFGKDLGTMTIVSVSDGSKIELTSPMAEAQLKGCHPIQNLGAVETYTRRYLWVTALEIVEHDAIDSSKPVETKLVHTPTGTPDVSQKRMSVIFDVAEAVKERFLANDMISAYDEYSAITDGEEKTALWKLLPSNVRSAIKKHAFESVTTN
jgi:hypothetical protein